VQRGPATDLEAQVVGLNGEAADKSAPGVDGSAPKASGKSRAPERAMSGSEGDEVDDLVGDLLSK
jgi:hypothetical protein